MCVWEAKYNRAVHRADETRVADSTLLVIRFGKSRLHVAQRPVVILKRSNAPLRGDELGELLVVRLWGLI